MYISSYHINVSMFIKLDGHAYYGTIFNYINQETYIATASYSQCKSTYIETYIATASY